jgi:hypothetical protein
MGPEKVDERIVCSEFLVINPDFALKWFVREWFFHFFECWVEDEVFWGLLLHQRFGGRRLKERIFGSRLPAFEMPEGFIQGFVSWKHTGKKRHVS